MKKHIIGALISVVIAELVGALSGFLSGNIKEVYTSLTLPPLSPPSWVFPVAWGILYALMGIAAYLVYISSAEHKIKNKALILYGVQLFVNFLWSILFFRFQEYGLGVIVILLLIVLVLITIVKFAFVSRPAAYLMIPYFLWLLFAAYLSIGIYRLN